MSADDPIGRTVLPIEDLMSDDEDAFNVPTAISHPFLPDGDVVFFGAKDFGKTTLLLTMILKWGYTFGHIVFVCPHVHPNKLNNPTPSRAKYLLLKEHLDNVTFVGMETEDDPDEAFEVLEEAFHILDQKAYDCEGQLLLVLDDYTAFLCYNPIKTMLPARWLNLKHVPAWGW